MRLSRVLMMNERKRTRENRSLSCLSLALILLLGIVVVLSLRLNLYRPDRPIPIIAPGSSSEPTFIVQIIRPRQGLPLGGLVPPELFRVDAKLGFDSTSEDAGYRVDGNVLELSGDEWELHLVFDQNRQITAESEVVFNLIFEDRVRRVRCTPGGSIIGTLEFTRFEDSHELSGNFDVELSTCEDAETAAPLGWPPNPLVLRGSFDRLHSGQRSD
jgi:hypothetical protein